jgi:hypothetical protein
MSEESKPEGAEHQQELEESALESDHSVTDKQEPYVDQEMADAYGFTPQQAKAMSMYL